MALATAIPFAELAAGDHQRLYSLKGEILARGVREVLGLELPVFAKRRFQHGATSREVFESKFGLSPAAYRAHFLSRFSSGA